MVGGPGKNKPHARWWRFCVLLLEKKKMDRVWTSEIAPITNETSRLMFASELYQQAFWTPFYKAARKSLRFLLRQILLQSEGTKNNKCMVGYHSNVFLVLTDPFPLNPVFKALQMKFWLLSSPPPPHHATCTGLHHEHRCVDWHTKTTETTLIAIETPVWSNLHWWNFRRCKFHQSE